jgi:hypothetical protein
MKVTVEQFGNKDLQGKLRYWEKTSRSATLPTTKSTWPKPGSNTRRRGGNPATNSLSYGAAVTHNILCGISFHPCLLVHDQWYSKLVYFALVHPAYVWFQLRRAQKRMCNMVSLLSHSRQNYVRTWNIKFHENSFTGSRVVARKQTDRQTREGCGKGFRYICCNYSLRTSQK